MSRDVAMLNEINAGVTSFFTVRILDNVVVVEVFILEEITKSFHGHARLQRPDRYNTANASCIPNRHDMMTITIQTVSK